MHHKRIGNCWANFNSDLSGDVTLQNGDTGEGVAVPGALLIAIVAHCFPEAVNEGVLPVVSVHVDHGEDD